MSDIPSWAMEAARKLHSEMGLTGGYTAQTTQDKEVEMLTRALVEQRREGARLERERCAEAIRWIDTPASLTNDHAFGWEHCRDKAVLLVRALADQQPEERG